MTLPLTELWQAVAEADFGALTAAPRRDAGLPGRNTNQIVATERGSYFVKLLGHGERSRRVQNSLGYDRFVRANAGLDLPRSPRCLLAEPEHGLLIFEQITDAESGAALMVEERFDTALAHRLGAQLAHLHQAPATAAAGRLTSWPSPNPAVLEGLPLHLVGELTGGELKAYGLLQSDPEVVRSLRDLAQQCATAEPTPVHGDLRVDQLLIGRTDPTSATPDAPTLWVIDWEEFGLADPARDTGTFLGEWLYRTILDIPTSRGDGVALPDAVDTGDIVGRGYAKLQRLSPIVTQFWRGYREQRPIGRDFTERTARLIGWHLLDRFMAGSSMSATLPAIHRAAAGVGRAALLNPNGVIELLGLEDTDD